ncbi:pilus assembly FimT family protein [Desulfovibrio gilichinskyi]|uniref:Prepilin-type N-terminal cleavage/methylation domain-containing protein n=1 Tax=Desulfovibrio gilichinskyi TaxID=1519643 RepID=A0A1X7EIX6_9BACT|nr:prepilin-type N-terminal cleavage/methylation domain-containing protein [Desulfovibrio gilichinskyi]SMF34302.1 prepilin-type N-terminal cleavage/methylation domain-containing protein [Desulfovibrio gilichinskyi]
MLKHSKRTLSGGFTFIELLIVLIIVGIGWFTLMPNLNLAGSKEKDSLNLVNAFIYKARSEAVETDSKQTLYIDFEKGLVKWKDGEIALPGRIVSGHLNEEPLGGDGVDFSIYPEGFSDEVRLVFADGVTLSLDPLSVRFVEM